MRKAKKCNTGKKKFVVVWLALVVLFLGSFIRPVDVQAGKSETEQIGGYHLSGSFHVAESIGKQKESKMEFF